MRKTIVNRGAIQAALLLGLTATPLLYAAPARADEISDAMEEARRAYGAGDGVAARTALEEALQLLGQRAAAGLAAALPVPLAGWTAEEAESSAQAAHVFGAGTQASQTYHNAQDQTVTVRFTADSPMVAQIAVMLTNPTLAGAMGKLVRVGTLRAVQASDGDLQMVVESRILVTVEGDAPAETKLAYARAVDPARLTSKR
ncbi:hypothetical protein [Belnapia moabensis]|uniref:hypothetical protein n=1 Tax=Belnapia moabensis TaxID=365533 RepID=UPI0006947268|nr:hypothetical protein [Belnapia moabensis]